MAKINPILEAMIIPVLTALAEQGGETLFQKMVDHDKDKAKIVLSSLNKTITTVAKNNKIKLT